MILILVCQFLRSLKHFPDAFGSIFLAVVSGVKIFIVAQVEQQMIRLEDVFELKLAFDLLKV